MPSKLTIKACYLLGWICGVEFLSFVIFQFQIDTGELFKCIYDGNPVKSVIFHASVTLTLFGGEREIEGNAGVDPLHFIVQILCSILFEALSQISLSLKYSSILKLSVRNKLN